jgi:type 1 glutamine amidotransferase
MMSTTGELFIPKGQNGNLLRDTSKPLPPELARAKELRESLLAFVKGGKGIMGIHAATDSSYQWKEWNEVMGGYFNGHPWGKITMTIDDPTNPVNAAFDGKPFTISDEIYTFKGSVGRERLRILTSIDLEASKIDQGFNRPQDHDYWVSWLNKYGDGRVFYCSLGHAEATYWNPTVLKHYLAGLQFVMGDLDADASPSGPLSPERLAANAAVASRAWVDVSKGEKWYQEKKDVKEQTFTGKLLGIPGVAGQVGILQRSHYYKLDDRTIFTGGKRSDRLEKMLGQDVEVRGRVVEQELEGQKLVELWVASVRPAKK